jgi:hypothetical protein
MANDKAPPPEVMRTRSSRQADDAEDYDGRHNPLHELPPVLAHTHTPRDDSSLDPCREK